MAKQKDSATKARQRFVDQTGQWVNKTPASIKAKQAKAWEKLLKDKKKKR